MTCICFSCHKEDHTTHDCSLVFPNKKKQNFERIDAMLATSNHVKRKKDERNPLNLVLRKWRRAHPWWMLMRL
jgi:uncharacterized protein YqiB (DUF1249 family)